MPQAAASITVMPQPSLGDGNRLAQAALQQLELLGLADETRETDRADPSPSSAAEPLQLGPVVAGSRDVEREIGPPQASLRQRPDRERYALYNASAVQRTRRWGSPHGRRQARA